MTKCGCLREVWVKLLKSPRRTGYRLGFIIEAETSEKSRLGSVWVFKGGVGQAPKES